MSERATAIPESVYQQLLTESPRGDYWDVATVTNCLLPIESNPSVLPSVFWRT